jgi:hypothetical protein
MKSNIITESGDKKMYGIYAIFYCYKPVNYGLMFAGTLEQMEKLINELNATRELKLGESALTKYTLRAVPAEQVRADTTWRVYWATENYARYISENGKI